MGSPHTNTAVITAEIESGFVAKDDLIPFHCSLISSCVTPLQMEVLIDKIKPKECQQLPYGYRTVKSKHVLLFPRESRDYLCGGVISIQTSTKHHAKTIVLAWSIKRLRTERKVLRSNLPSFIGEPGLAKEPHPSRTTVVVPSIHRKSNQDVNNGTFLPSLTWRLSVV
ncbi:hypothetical protein TNCV_1940181 [Trichonephila clavipes]|nr:hypothetical protein TNCV_1940181 [Trichonephila clavipes]